MNDDELHELIRQTHLKPEFSASFQRDVWARVSVVEQNSWTARYRRWSESLFQSISRPVPAMAVVIMTLLLGAGLGRLSAPDKNPIDSRLAYVTSINPVAAAHFNPGE